MFKRRKTRAIRLVFKCSRFGRKSVSYSPINWHESFDLIQDQANRASRNRAMKDIRGRPSSILNYVLPLKPAISALSTPIQILHTTVLEFQRSLEKVLCFLKSSVWARYKLEPDFQLGWSWVSFGHTLGSSWLELAWIWSSSNLPTQAKCVPPFGHLGQLSLSC